MSISKRIENRGGVLIIIIVGVLAIMKVITSGLEEQVSLANYKHVSYSNWYNAKSIKQVLKEGERDYLISLVNSGLVAVDKLNEIQARIQITDDLSEKYNEEKTEILIGSANIPEASWTQDLDGELGKIIGLKKWEEISINSSKVISKIELGALFLQIGVVFGILGLIVDASLKLQKVFTGIMVVTGLVGIAFGLYGYSLLI